MSDLPIAFLEKSGGAVFFSPAGYDSAQPAGKSSGATGTSLNVAEEVREVEDKLKVVPWGEDNRFPQRISAMLDHCGIGKPALNFKAKAIYGGGIIPGKVTGIDPKTKEDIIEPLDRVKYAPVYEFLEKSTMPIFWAEFLNDWTTYVNCFPEIVFSKNGKTITNIVHQESSDCRYGPMQNGKIKKVYLSKLWGLPGDQLIKFAPREISAGFNYVSTLEEKHIVPKDCIDMYDPVASCKEIVEGIKNRKGLISAILPVNYPSTNKTYYQLPSWDGARLSGWFDIASRVPGMLKRLFNSNFNIKYHIEVPESYFERLHGLEKWKTMLPDDKARERKTLVRRMDKFLSGDDNAFKSFVSTFDVAPHDGKEYGRLKITVIEDKINVDKETLMSSAADIQILIAMQVHPTIFGAGTLGTGTQRTGGSDIREAFLVQNAMHALERQIIVSPLNLVRDYNREVGGISEWEKDIRFFFRDTVLTTLDTGAGSKKVLS